RRFFDVADLVSVRVEDPEVFAATHARIAALAAAGQITGVRVDHIDGLWDPLAYLTRLQRALETGDARAGARVADEADQGSPAPAFYVLVEKILSAGEELPADWPVHGTTGYEF